MNLSRLVTPAVAGFLLLAGEAVAARATTVTLDSGRVEAIARWLPEKPGGLGKPISDRSAWDRVARDPASSATVSNAEKLLTRPLPPQPDDLYLEFSRNGNRTNFQNVAFDRRNRLPVLVIAECVESQGRFLPALEDLITTLCAERSWVLPAHDKTLQTFHGKEITIDLASSALGWQLAVADSLLGERLRPETRAGLRRNVAERVLEPVAAMLHGKRRPDNWFTMTNNWNPVCFAGVVGAALLLVESPRERAMFVAAAEKYSENFLAGFTADGYCSEGVGYWNYGFGHYILLSELIRLATGGEIELLARPNALQPALFGARIEILNGIYPAFADCSVKARPAERIMWFLNRRFDLKLEEYADPKLATTHGHLGEALIYSLAAGNAVAPRSSGAAAGTAAAEFRLRDWFQEAGVLIARPEAKSSCRLAVALKGGHNAEHHNHNDLGSYVVVSGREAVLLDPGVETYTARTFSSKRYESKMLNSFGHPVPVVAGQLQRSGKDAQAKVLETSFGEQADTLRLDLTSAYVVPELKRLERKFVYSRVGTGELLVEDLVEFGSPQAFETAFVTLGKWEQKSSSTLEFRSGKERLQVTLDTGGEPFEVVPEEIRENAPVTPTRVGIRLTRPVTSARVSARIQPVGK